MLEIALNNDKNGIYQKDIARNQEISYKYLDQIMNALKVAGLVTKAAGRKSGYVLTKLPAEISIYDIHNAFEPGICIIDCVAADFSCNRESKCALKGFWGELNNQIISYFKSTSVQNLMEKQTKLDDAVNINV